MAEDDSFEELIRYLKEVRNFDFTGYKRTSLARRVDRQMQAIGVESYEAYRDLLEVQPSQFTALFNAILINVTSFFRDVDAWSYLRETLLPDLVRDARRDRIRVWSAGCASGEEAYSLAMSLAEVLGIDEFRRRVKIYATDVDDEALHQARQASYTSREMTGVPDDLREKYFEPGGDRWTFRTDLRRSVIFGRNDLIGDAPISHVDLLVCRNALMYFNAETQLGVLRRLHFALEPRGILFLGKAEMLLSHSDLFSPLDLRRRFFTKVAEPEGRMRPQLMIGVNNRSGEDGGQDDRLIVETMATSPVAQVTIDAEGRLALSNRRAQELFMLPAAATGRPFQDLELSYRPLEVRSWLEQAVLERRPVVVRDVEWLRNDGRQSYDVQIVPLFSEEGMLLGTSIHFTDVTEFRRLQRELEFAHRQLETAYEELQSTNEELETMNEELQSMNDELQSSSDELRERTGEIGDLNNFMRSILGSLQSGVAVVDPELTVQVWNRRMDDLWGVRGDEAVGQHLLNLDIGLPVEELRPLLRAVLADGLEEPPAEEATTVSAIDRRGRPIDVKVSVSPLHGEHAAPVLGAVILLDARPPEPAG